MVNYCTSGGVWGEKRTQVWAAQPLRTNLFSSALTRSLNCPKVPETLTSPPIPTILFASHPFPLCCYSKNVSTFLHLSAVANKTLENRRWSFCFRSSSLALNEFNRLRNATEKGFATLSNFTELRLSVAQRVTPYALFHCGLFRMLQLWLVNVAWGRSRQNLRQENSNANMMWLTATQWTNTS